MCPGRETHCSTRPLLHATTEACQRWHRVGMSSCGDGNTGSRGHLPWRKACHDGARPNPSALPTWSPWLLMNWQLSKVASPFSMFMTPVCRPWLPMNVQLVNVKKEPKPCRTPSGVPATDRF